MHCPVYRATIPASLCLTYQDRAAGKWHTKDKNKASIECWIDKYQTCLKCEAGKKVKANGGNDMDADVQALKEKRSLHNYTCRKCGEPKDREDFYVSSEGKVLVAECKSCASDRHKATALAKKATTVDETFRPTMANNDVQAQTVVYSRICRQCGHMGPDKDFHHTGMHGVTNVCKECVAIKRETTMQKNKKPSHVVVSYPAGAIVLDFSEYPEIEEQLRVAAKTNFRTVNNEILYRLVNYVKQ